jgi:hypothetical protein
MSGNRMSAVSWTVFLSVSMSLIAPELTYALPPGTYVANTDGSGLERIAGPTFPHWLPAGNRLALIAGRACYGIDADGGNKTLAYRDSEASHLWEAKVSGSGRYVAAVAEIAGVVEMPLRVVDLRVGRLLHSAPINSLDAAAEGFAAEGCFDWHRATDALAYIPWAPTKPSTGLRTFNPATGQVSTLAKGLTPRRLTWRQPDRTLLVLCSGAVLRVDPGDPRGQTVWVPRLPATGDGFDFLNRFLSLQDGDVLYCRPWDQSQPEGFFSRAGVQVEPQWSGAVAGQPEDRNFAYRDLQWVAGETVILSEILGSYEESAGPPRLRLLQGNIGTPLGELEVLSTFEDWDAGDALSISPDGARVALGVGVRPD